MPYLINKSDGSALTIVSDGQIDNLTTDLTLIGKNYSGFGESLNENFVKLLENFAGASRPTKPTRGQIWFDVTELKLKVYNGTAFQPVSSATISNQQPTTLTPGDLWFNDTDKQLYFYDGVETFLLGPLYTSSQGLSGIRVITILDTLNQNKVITALYNNGALIGIFSSSTLAFTPKVPIVGYPRLVGGDGATSAPILPGFNPGDIAGFKIDATATRAQNILKPNGVVKTADQIVYNNEDGSIIGRLAISQGLAIGSEGQVQLLEVNGELLLQNIADNKLLKIAGKRGSISEDVIVIDPSSQTINMYAGVSASQVNIGGNLTVDGNFRVLGNTVSIDVTNVRVEDKNIELGYTGAGVTLTDAEADGGGIILKADTDKLWTWSDTRDAWESNQNINLILKPDGVTYGYYAINGTTLLEYDGSVYRLTSAVTQAPGISTFGKQNQVNVGPGLVSDPTFLRLENNKISSLISNQDIELEPNGSGSVALIGSPRITGLANPTSAQDAATKDYVDTQDRGRSLVLALDISDGITNTGIAGFLEQIAPVGEYQNGTFARILCSIVNNLAVSIDLNASLNESTGTFVTPGPSTGTALIDVSFSTVGIPGQPTTISRLVKIFQIQGGAWTFVL
jgi:hypothetical protein